MQFVPVCRSQARLGSVTLAQFVRPSNASKLPPPPCFKAPPPPPPGAPPSAVQPASTSAARSQGTSVSAPEPRRNAWKLPLAGCKPSQAHADHLETLRQAAAHVESSASGVLSHQVSHGIALSGNAAGAIGSKSDIHPDLGAASARGQQGDMAEAAPSSPAQVTEPSGRSLSSLAAAAAALQDFSHGSGQYPQVAKHVAQIADLQASSTVSSCN